MRDVQAAIEERLHLYLWGRATYEDMFEGSEPHFFEFCYRLDVSGARPKDRRWLHAIRPAQPLRRGQPAAGREPNLRACEESPQQSCGLVFADAAINLRPVMAGGRRKTATPLSTAPPLGSAAP